METEDGPTLRLSVSESLLSPSVLPNKRNTVGGPFGPIRVSHKSVLPIRVFEEPNTREWNVSMGTRTY